MNPNLMQVALNTITFLKINGKKVIQPEKSADELLSVQYLLQQLTLAERQELVGFARECAARQERFFSRSLEVKLLKSLDENLNLLEDL